MESGKKSLTEEIQDNIYKKRLEIIKVRGGKSREELIKKANTKIIHRKKMKK